MNSRPRPLLAAFAALLAAGPGLAAETAKMPAAAAPPPPARVNAAAPAIASFDAFRLIGDRNIFNPNRVGRSSRSADEAPPRVDTISFVGTMEYEKGLFAFFDSPDSIYRKALHEGETIGPFTVKTITADAVDLVRDAKPVSLRMGQQLRRPAGGDWSVIAADVVRTEARAAEAASAPASSAPPAIPADASETLRRLMELRQKQLKQ